MRRGKAGCCFISRGKSSEKVAATFPSPAACFPCRRWIRAGRNAERCVTGGLSKTTGLNEEYHGTQKRQLGDFDCNLLFRLLCLHSFGQSDCEHALLEASLDLIRVHALGHGEAPLE